MHFQKLEEKRRKNGHILLALIDPDQKNDSKLKKIVENINRLEFDAVLIGGSSIKDDLIETRINYIKSKIKLPIILFPGSSKQVTGSINSMLYLNLISGRNTRYLIEEHVESSTLINDLKIETIPTAYILLDGGKLTSVVKVSKTSPLCMENQDNVLSHALAGQFLGNKLIYFDNGSGAKNIIDLKLLEYVKRHVKIPIMVGGGIKTKSEVESLINNGADYIVIGNALEDLELRLFQ